ncbi:hypothetical protein [Streptomyces griseocarneus]|uniref:hypothetical protein n=1 Tax=Streptomyces griseocarneus TaxID=51201 RepID=UPI00167DF4AF|nr:hypothetical protein [Streptomyces griseocarneus]GHG83117.1 hypothetical protein GCM10018779_66190 [Streptomyces griseocarneus]
MTAHTRRTARLGLFAVCGAVALALTATGCGSGDSSGAGDKNTPGPQQEQRQEQPKEQPQQQPDAAGAVGLATAKDAKLGTVVTDAKGFTLYRFDKDKAKPSASNCNGDCAAAWPPVTAADQVSLKGIDKSLVATVTRADGSKQLTLGGWPLYRFAKDAKPGETKGQGVGGTWFAAGPQGKKAAPSGDSGSTGGTSGGTGGYGY